MCENTFKKDANMKLESSPPHVIDIVAQGTIHTITLSLHKTAHYPPSPYQALSLSSRRASELRKFEVG